ncbi:hypothetical protein AB1Y20_018153 [Prymnesium parvum]|uniref:Uncharacterized protein n=1 Tax=Prymnesium parvum TaxID=97485 RepID=A0AB34JRA3_PRYPA
MALSREEIVAKLDQIPTFAVVNAQGQLMPIRPDAADSAADGTECVVWYTEPADAKGALEVARAQSPEADLRLGVTPLGKAFALVQGWSTSNSAHPLRLQANQLLTATLKDMLKEQLQQQGLDPGTWQMPIFSCDALQSPRMLPLFLSRADLGATWVAMGRSVESLPEEVTVVDIRILVAQMQTDLFDWKIIRFIAPEASVSLVQAAEQARANADPLDEPPPLE